MKTAAAALVGAALLAAGCGEKTAVSAAEVAPRDARALMSIPAARESPLTRRALGLSARGLRFQRLLDRAQWARVARRRVELAELAGGGLVAYVRPADRKELEQRLEDAGLAHARRRGWVVFAPSRALVDAGRTDAVLADAPWYAAAGRAAGTAGATLAAREGGSWFALSAEGGRMRRTVPGRGTDAPHPLAADIPADAVAAVAAHDAAGMLRSLSFGPDLERAVGLRLDDVARATPGAAILYVREGRPIPSLTLVSDGGAAAAGARIVRELAPNAAPGIRERVGDLTLSHVALGAADFYYGTTDGKLVVSDDPDVHLGGDSLELDDLPDETASWVYLDAARGAAALQLLGEIAGLPVRLPALDGLRSVLLYTTHGRGTAVETLLVR